MAMFSTFIQVIQIISALVVIGLVLIQHGKGADMGAAFGSGASGSVFGSAGSANFLSRTTAIAAAVFFTSTLLLSFVINERSNSNNSVIHSVSETSVPAAPVVTPPVVSEKAKEIKPADVKPADVKPVEIIKATDIKPVVDIKKPAEVKSTPPTIETTKVVRQAILTETPPKPVAVTPPVVKP